MLSTAPGRAPHSGRSSLPALGGRALRLLAFYIVLALVLMAPVLRHPREVVWSRFDDVNLFAWWLERGRDLLVHGGDPSRATSLNTPTGLDALWNTSVMGLSLPASGVTALAGPFAAYNVLITLAPAANAWVSALAASRWMSRQAAAVAGLFFGFGAYTLGQMQGHLNLAWALYPALVLLLLVDLSRGSRSPLRTGLALAAATVWQFFVSSELLTACIPFFGALGLATLVVTRGNGVRVRRLVPGVLTAVATASVVLAYPLLRAFTSPDRPRGPVRHAVAYSADLANLVVPTTSERVRVGTAIASRFSSNVTENGLYVGLPVLVVCVLTCLLVRRPVVRVMGLTAVALLVLSLGPRVHLAGHVLSVPFPGAVPAEVPVIQHVLPIRLSLFVGLCAALLLGLAYDRTRASSLTRAGLAVSVVVAGLCLASLVPATPKVLAVDVPAYFRGPAVRALPAGSLVRTVPTATAGFLFGRARPMGWQAAAGMRYRTTGGYFLGRQTALDAFDTLTRSVVRTGRTPVSTVGACADLLRTRTVAVIVLADQPYSETALRTVQRVLGVTGVPDGGVVVFRVPRAACPPGSGSPARWHG